MSLSKGHILPNQPLKLVNPIPVPYHGSGLLTSHSYSYSVHVAATPLQCLERLIDSNTWQSWNKLTPRAVFTVTPPITDETVNAPELRELITRPGHLYPGVHFTADVHMNTDSPTRTNTAPEKCMAVERFETEDGRLGYRVVWQFYGIPWAIHHCERVHEFIEAKNGEGTEYLGWETFGGTLQFIMRYAMRDMMLKGLGVWNEGFQASFEQPAAES